MKAKTAFAFDLFVALLVVATFLIMSISAHETERALDRCLESPRGSR